ncbi:MAG: hypothetical protein EXR71_14080 [Myxococcales bacterium]|nr:hypothetical protein [Myxococcales bacterium]
MRALRVATPWLGTLCLVWGTAQAADAPGTILPRAPTTPPGRAAAVAKDPLAAAIEARLQGDLRRSAWHYEKFLAGKSGGSGARAGAQVALGLVYLDLDEPNAASALFSKVRAGAGAVAPWGAWFEALADHERGRHSVAASECAAYRKQWPTGPHADECLVLMGDAYVAAELKGPAIGAYSAYLEAHPDSPREEPLRLGIALAVSTTDQRTAIPMLQRLVLDHQYHSTGDTAQRRLDELATDGFATALADDGVTACRIAAERKRCGYEADAWERFGALEVRAAEDPNIASWIEDHADQFRWGTSQYLTVARLLAERYAEKPNADVAWQRFRALARGGDWVAAEAQLVAGATTHGGRFKNKEELARAQLLSGNYLGARDTWTALGKGGGAFGREARWLAAFAAFRAGDDADALARLDKIVGGDDWTAEAARYYRVRTLQRLARAEDAAAQAEVIVRAEPWSWYAALLQNDSTPAPAEVARDGTWPGPSAPSLPPLRAPTTAGAALAAPASMVRTSATAVDWSALTWTGAGFAAAGTRLPTSPPFAPAPQTGRDWDRRPDSYASGIVDVAEGARLLERLQTEHPDLFPHALAAAELARGGAFELAAPIVARMYDAIDPVVGGTAHPEVTLTVTEWRQIFLLVRDNYHVARFSWGLHKGASTPEAKVAAWRLSYPSAEADALWRHGQHYDVDPLMALGLMRQESVYRQWALSATGAIGLMQVMPRTGARIAARIGDRTYSPDILESPSTNVRYGMWYLHVLMDRFGGSWPLAVASYNGGPHNVSAWLHPWGDNIRIDDFVEQMPYTETRDYVKKVTGWYMAYVALYGTPEDRVRIPLTVTRDDPTLVNF